MKEMNNIEKYTDKDWEELSSILSDEKNDDKDLLSLFMADDDLNTINTWKELNEMNSDKEINVDKAWDKVLSRIKENGLVENKQVIRRSLTGSAWFRIAAALLILLGIGTVLVITNEGLLNRKTVVATSDNQKNLQVTLPDGSNIFLNRNTRLSYRPGFGKHGRNITLTGEAFFDITHDENNPFIIDAGKASIKVLGTSFNVITDNPESAVEVFVKTGKVVVSDNEGTKNLILDPGFIGIMNSEISEKTVNDDPNYMSWNTGLLLYNGQTLDIVFRDLKRAYNMDIIADDPSILQNKWTTDPIDNQPQETIIRLICGSFNLSYTKDGDVYHLSKR
jgi:ferric-dicitrate binding protein FerR (iron transport regulator)